MRRIVLGVALLTVLAAAWLRTPRRASGLLDLEVNNAPLAEVLQQLERKSGQTIRAAQKLDAKITLSVRQQPLELILNQVADQAAALSILVMPIYSVEPSLQEFVKWFESGAAVSRWTETTNLFSGDRRMVYFRDAREPEPLVSLSVTNLAATEVAPLLSQAAGAHVVLEDRESAKVSLAFREEPIDEGAEALAQKLGKKWARLHILQPKPKQLMKIAARGEEVQETSGNSKRIVRRGAPSPEERARLDKLVTMTPDERRAFMQEEFNSKAAQRMLDRIRNRSPEQRVDEMRGGGRHEDIETN